MALGWMDVQRIKRVEEAANKLGFIFAAGSYTWGNEGVGVIYLKPKDDMLPIYSRDAEIFNGSIEQIDTWLIGIEWARHYDAMIKLSNDKQRVRKEQDERNRQLMRTLKTGKKTEGSVGSLQDIEIEEDIPF